VALGLSLLQEENNRNNNHDNDNRNNNPRDRTAADLLALAALALARADFAALALREAGEVEGLGAWGREGGAREETIEVGFGEGERRGGCGAR